MRARLTALQATESNTMKKTIYVRPEHVELWRNAEHLALRRGVALSTLVTEGLGLVLGIGASLRKMAADLEAMADAVAGMEPDEDVGPRIAGQP